MEDNKISDILFTALERPEYARTEYLAKEQKESGYSESVFWRMLFDALNHYHNVIESDIVKWNKQGNDITDSRLALFTLTKGKFRGHLGRSEITLLADTLKALGRTCGLKEEVIFVINPLHDTNENIEYIEKELKSLVDLELQIKFLSFQIERTQNYIDELIKRSVQHPSLNIEGERADRLNKARVFLVFLNDTLANIKKYSIDKKKEKKWNINDEECRAEYYECMKKKDISELVNDYLQNYEYLFQAMKHFIEYYPNSNISHNGALNGFEGLLQMANFNCSLKFLCEEIEKYFNSHSVEHIKLLNNSIDIKVQGIEKSFNDKEFNIGYNKIKSTRIDSKMSYYETMIICSEEFDSRIKAFNSCRDNDTDSFGYGTLETFYKETVDLLNAGKNRINNLFSPKSLPEAPQIKQELGKVLNREDYFSIILEIYSLHRNTVSEFISDKVKRHLPANPQFVECLYKDISKVMEGVHKPGDLDLDISTGDFEIEYEDIKLTGNPTIFDDVLIYLWMKLSEIYTEKGGVLNLTGHLKNFENNILNRNDYTPAYTLKISKLNKELKRVTGNEPKIASISPKSKREGTKKRYAEIAATYNDLEHLPLKERVKQTCEKHHIHSKTLDRALKES